MTCSPQDVTINPPDGPSGPMIPGFGTPFALKTPNINQFPSGFPEDLLKVYNDLQMLLPPGAVKPGMSNYYSKNVFDGIMSLMDKFFPFLMLYKFFLPVLNLIICIIEVLCSIPNPFKLIRAMRRLFRKCIPEFLNLFPVFSIVIMLISLLLLLVALVEHIVSEALKMIEVITRNLKALDRAFKEGSDESVLAIARKIGALLCSFQNLFVLISMFTIIFQSVKDIIRFSTAIPPCDSSNTSSDGCCTPEVCPDIVKKKYTRSTGSFKYLNKVNQIISGIYSPLREESWQIYDASQSIPERFINIVDGYDVPAPKPVFFPTDSNYNNISPPAQCPYLIDVRVFYTPTSWGRTGLPRYIQFKDCVVTKAPTRNLNLYNNGVENVNDGVLKLVGGLGYEDDSTTQLTGFSIDGITPISSPATLENFLHKPDNNAVNPIVTPFDGYQFLNMEYTFKPNIEVLIGKNILTLGCDPDFALDKGFVNTSLAGDVVAKLSDIIGIVTSDTFPDTEAFQQCLSLASDKLRNNLTTEGVADFQSTVTICANKIKDDANKTVGELIVSGFSACNSSITIDVKKQFTTKPINVSVALNDSSGVSITSTLNEDVAKALALKIKGHVTVGSIDNFKYDGSQFFTSQIKSDVGGNGKLMVSFDNNLFCTNNISDDLSVAPSRTLQEIDYSFVFAPATSSTPTTSIATSISSGSDSAPRRDESDLANETSGKDI